MNPVTRTPMRQWIHALPIIWMSVVIFGGTYLATAAIHVVVTRLATGDRLKAFKGVSAGLLSPLGVIFGLLIAFLAAQVWNDLDHASVAVNHEASSLRAVVILARVFPGESEARLRMLVARQIRDTREVEWPAMGRQDLTLAMLPAPLAEALEVTVALPAATPGQITAQREIVSALENALDARRQRILASRAGVNWVKWTAVITQAICTLVAIALVHSDNRMSSRIALGIFATAVAGCITVIVAHDQPFTGQLGVSPAPLLNIQPESTPTKPTP